MVNQSRLKSLLEQGDSKARAGDPGGAIRAYDKLLALAPGYPGALERKAAALATTGDMVAALACWTELVDMEPQAPEPYIVRARALSYMNRYADAIDDFRHAIALGDGSDASLLEELGLCLQGAGRLDEAIDTYRRAIGLNSSDSGLRVALGDALLDAGRVDQAVEAFNSAGSGGEPDFTDADWTTRGDRLLAADRSADAITMYHTALSIRPSAGLWQGIAQAYLTAKQYDEAIAATESVFKLGSEDADTWNVRGCAFFESGRFAQALECFDKVADKEGNAYIGWSNKAVALYNLDRVKEAVTAVQRALEFLPDDAALWAALSSYQLALGQNEVVLESANHCLKLDERCTTALINQGQALRLLGRLEEALNCCEHALKIDSSEVGGWYTKAMALADLGREAAAVATLDEAISAVRAPQQALHAKALMLSDKLKRHAEAIEPMRQAWEIAPEDTMIVSDYAEILIKNGRYAEGRALAVEVAARDTAPSEICAMRFIIFASYVLSSDLVSSDDAFHSFIEYYVSNFVEIERRFSWNYDGLISVVRTSPFPEWSQFIIETLVDLQAGRIQARDVPYLRHRVDDNRVLAAS